MWRVHPTDRTVFKMGVAEVGPKLELLDQRIAGFSMRLEHGAK